MADIGRLPVQLLAYVLAKLQPQEVMQSCAPVSRSWRQAAGLCISKIAVPRCDQAKAGALQSWLLTHGAAAVTSMTVHGPRQFNQPKLELLLPVQQLTTLQSLYLTYLRVGPAPAAGGGGADNAPVLGPALSAALTSLQLHDCILQLQGLSALTNLRSLTLTGLTHPEGEAASNLSIIAEAIPRLQQLTSVYLGDEEAQAATLAELWR